MRPWRSGPRHRGVERLDDPTTSEALRARAMADLARSNALFGGTTAVLRALRTVWRSLPRAATLVDVGTGMGDIPRAVAAMAARRDVHLRTVGVDGVPFQARLAQPHVHHAVAADARTLPFANGSADVVTCSQLLHHFFDDDLTRLIAELHRVSRDWVIVSDLRRSSLAWLGFFLAGRALRFHAITVGDGLQSIRRGFTPDELDRLVWETTGAHPTIRRASFWRLTATWRKSPVR